MSPTTHAVPGRAARAVRPALAALWAGGVVAQTVAAYVLSTTTHHWSDVLTSAAATLLTAAVAAALVLLPAPRWGDAGRAVGLAGGAAVVVLAATVLVLGMASVLLVPWDSSYGGIARPWLATPVPALVGTVALRLVRRDVGRGRHAVALRAAVVAAATIAGGTVVVLLTLRA